MIFSMWSETEVASLVYHMYVIKQKTVEQSCVYECSLVGSTVGRICRMMDWWFWTFESGTFVSDVCFPHII